MTFSSTRFCLEKPLSTDLWSGAESTFFDRHLQSKLQIPACLLMENAGQALASLIRNQISGSDLQILHLVGPGNNGGDALVAARQLAGIPGLEQLIWAPLGLPEKDDSPAQSAWRAVQGFDIPVSTSCTLPEHAQPQLIVDALFGVGLTRPLQGAAAASLAQLERLASPILAVDLPSGLHADQGTIMGRCLSASLTLSFVGAKQGFYLKDGPRVCGKIYLADIGVAPEYARSWLQAHRKRLD